MEQYCLSDRGKLLELHRRELADLLQSQVLLGLHRRVNADLSHVGVSAILVVANDSDLDHEGTDGVFSDVLDRYDDPAWRFAEVNDLDFVQVVEVSSAADWDSRRSVRLVEFVVAVDEDLADCGLAWELNVDQVR